MLNQIGQKVRADKRNLVHSLFAARVPRCPSMLSQAEYRRAFIERTRAARAQTPYSQAKMAELLELGPGGQHKYKQYEIRSLLPHHLVVRFCDICRVPLDFLFNVEATPVRTRTARH